MTDRDLFLQLLSTLREHVARVRRRRTPDLETFRADVDLQDSLALSLLVATQEAVDIAFHICTDEGWGLPASKESGTRSEPASTRSIASARPLRGF